MKLWGGRFQKETDCLVEDFHSSISFDQRLYQEDITGSIAHARMLGKTGIIKETEAELLISGLAGIFKDIAAGEVEFDISAEDIHMNIETLLTKKVGAVGKKLHTARSRNDQVALDNKMYVKTAIKQVLAQLIILEETLLRLAEEHIATIMPGFTHLQKAQPITFGHHLMAYFQMFKRDYQRLQDAYVRTNIMPLGSGALAGTTFPIDREMVARELGFAEITDNSLDGVSDRDYCLEFEACGAISMMHLSRLCEELILWSSDEYKYIILDDAYSTGSSIMPQKKNPDVAELMRGKTGRVYGNLMSSLAMMKSLPLAYNKDMQEDKEALFDTVDTWKKSLLLMSPMLATMQVQKARMLRSTSGGFTNATDLADYLAKKGLAFRDAHHIVGSLVLKCVEEKRDLLDLTLVEFQECSSLIEADIYEAIAIESCVNRRTTIGGPAEKTVAEAIVKGWKWLENLS
ncbi:MAG: argininosuccinate lyase [Clostridia bacterium]